MCLGRVGRAARFRVHVGCCIWRREGRRGSQFQPYSAFISLQTFSFPPISLKIFSCVTSYKPNFVFQMQLFMSKIHSIRVLLSLGSGMQTLSPSSTPPSSSSSSVVTGYAAASFAQLPGGLMYPLSSLNMPLLMQTDSTSKKGRGKKGSPDFDYE